MTKNQNHHKNMYYRVFISCLLERSREVVKSKLSIQLRSRLRSTRQIKKALNNY